MIIGVVGKARSGKDTFSKMLAEVLFKKTKRVFILMAYAQTLKLKVQADFDLSYDQLWGDEKEEQDKRYLKRKPGAYSSYWTAREIMQAYGEFFRSIDYDYWVKSLFNKIDEDGLKDVIITDVRHPNEADPIIERKGYIIKVIRNESPGIHGSDHISETAMDKYPNIDFKVINNSSLKELKFAADEAADFIIEKENGRLKNG